MILQIHIIMIFKPLSSTLINVSSKRLLARTSQKPRPDSKQYRLWKIPGDHVLRKDILAKQYTIYWHPGLNVGINQDRTIYALCDGVMVLTEEKFNPDWNFTMTKKIYKAEDGLEKNVPDYQRYLHVIPKRRVSEFKLIDLV